MNKPPVSIVVPSYNDEATLAACVESVLARTDYPDWELIVVDDGSTDGSLSKLKANPKLKIIRRQHQGIGAALNAGFAAAEQRDIVRLHADVVIESADWLARFVDDVARLPQAGVVGAKLVYPDGRIHTEGRNIINGIGFAPRHRDRKAFAPDGPGGKPVEVDAVHGGLAYYRREVITAVGGIDENYGHAWTEDMDFCVAARLHGFKVYVDPGIKAVHYTRSWGPTSMVILGGTEPSLRQLAWQAKRKAEQVQGEYWEAKWGWNPYYPDLNEVRRLYGHTEICWSIGEPMRYRPSSETPTVDCAMVTANNLGLLKRCMESLTQTDYPLDRIKIYIADNGSTDGTLEYLDGLKGNYPMEIVLNKLPLNTGVPVGLNWAVIQGKGELVARLDDDIVLPANWLKLMVQDLRARPFAGCVGPKILNDDARKGIQCGAYRHFPGLFGHEDETDFGQADYLARAVHVRGCCNLYRRDVFARCGLFDLRFSPSQFDDPDHHIALASAGYEILYEGRVGVIHKLNNGLARSYAAMSSQHGNAGKMYGKWGGDIFEILEKALDYSREGRYLPDDGDTASAFLNAPEMKQFPRPDAKPDVNALKVTNNLSRELSTVECRENLVNLAEEHVKHASTQRRDGFPRHAIDTLNTALNFAPAFVPALEALAHTYRESGQVAIAKTIARYGLFLAPENLALFALSNGESAVRNTDTSLIHHKDKADHIGEAQVSVSAKAVANGERRLRVLMVNSFENRTAGGDMHQLKKTKQYLEKFGVDVDVCTSPRPDSRGYDLVHVYNLWFPHQTLAQLKAIRLLTPNIPVVMSPIFWNMAEKAWADGAVPQIFTASKTNEELEARLKVLANDKLMFNGCRRSEAREPNFAGYTQYQLRILEMVDYLLPQSQAEMTNLRQTLRVQKPFNLVHNGAELDVFAKATPDWFIEKYKIRDFVLTVGLVEARKNQLMLLHALKDQGVPVVVVGRSYDPNYLRLCRKHAPAGSLFIEHMPHEHLASAFKAARVHALPSWMECASFANVEAALSGCSLVVSDRTSEPEYFGDNAYYCDPASVESIRNAVTRALRNHKADAPKREKLRQQFLTGYTWQNAAEQTLRGYEATLALRKKAGSAPIILSSPQIAAPQVAKAAKTASPFVIPTKPRVSVVMLTYNNLALTQRCLDSVAHHTTTVPYEVIVVDNQSTDGTREYLAAQQREGKLVAIFNDKNEGFAHACNQGAAVARGEFVLFLNNDTEVQPGWLEPLVRACVTDPKVAAVGSKLLFPDQTIQHAGVILIDNTVNGDPLLAKHAFYKKPQDFPPANQPMHYQVLTAACLLVRKDVFDQVGGFDEGYWNGYEDVDLCLKLGAAGHALAYRPDSVVLHHESQSGPERFREAKKNISRLHERWLGKVRPELAVKPDGTIVPTEANPQSPVVVAAKDNTPLASIIVLAHNQIEHTRKCVESLLAHTRAPYEVILVDNGSTDGTAAYFAELRKAHTHFKIVTNRTNRGFAAGNNQGLAIAQGEVVVLLNNDTILTPGWIEGMTVVLDAEPAVGLIGPVSNRVSGPQQVAATYKNDSDIAEFATQWAAKNAGQTKSVQRLVGFCLLARRSVLEAIGGLDERFGSGNFEDDDFCLRAKFAGFGCRIARGVFIHHTGGQTFKGAGLDYRQTMMRNWELFRAKWEMASDVTMEKGYPIPQAAPNNLLIKVPLVSLDSTHEVEDGSHWRETEPMAVTAKTKVEIPPVARLGSIVEARAMFGRRDFPNAWNATVAALQARPFNPEAHLLLAEIALAAGDGNSARACAKRAGQLAPNWKAPKQFLQKSIKGEAKPEWLKLPESADLRLTVCVVAKNEEKFLAQCLASVKGLAQQLIVVDTGSTDRTVAIAKEHGAEVHSFEWCDDFSAARNVALQHVTGDWILMLDADEELPADQHAKLRADIAKADAMAYRVPLVNQGDEAHGASYIPRLFRNAPGAFFYGRIHEQVFGSLLPLCKAWGLETKLGTGQLLHHGYTKELIRDRNKVERNLKLLRLAVAERPNDPNLVMNLGLELVKSGDLETGLTHYRTAFRLMSAQPAGEVVPELREVLLTQLTAHLYKKRAYDEIVKALNSPLAKNGGLTASLHFSLGLAQFELKQYRDAAEQMRHCLAKRKQAGLTPINTDILTAAPHHCLALSLARTDDHAGAEQAFEAGKAEPGAEALKIDYAKFLETRGRAVDALHLLHEVVQENSQKAIAWQIGGEIALSQPKFFEFAVDWTSEAIAQLPEDVIIVAQRAEALLLSQQTKAALPLWERVAKGNHRISALAAQIICATVEGQTVEGVRNVAEETAVSRAFVDWYRKLLAVHAHETIVNLNTRVEALRAVLPSAASLVDTLIAEAQQAEPAVAA